MSVVPVIEVSVNTTRGIYLDGRVANGYLGDIKASIAGGGFSLYGMKRLDEVIQHLQDFRAECERAIEMQQSARPPEEET